MITVFLGTAIGIFLAIRNEFKHGYYSYFLDYLMMGIIGAFFGTIGGFFISWALPCATKTHIEQREIVNLQDGSSIEGSSFLGSGYVNEEMRYTFYYIEDSGNFKLKQIDADYAEIKYTTGTPTMYKESQVDADGWEFWNNFAIDFYCSKYIIEIPNGSIENNYHLDAE